MIFVGWQQVFPMKEDQLVESFRRGQRSRARGEFKFNITVKTKPSPKR
jgi:hypothetical protein